MRFTIKQFVVFNAALSAGVAILVFASHRTTQWRGSRGYLQLEYELTFKDSKGVPLEGVELRVQNANGNDFFCFPVTDFVPGQSPTSDKQGVMRFHHVSTAVEWDEHGWSLFWVYGVQTTRSPEYVCRFFHRGKEIHRVAYENLQSWDWNGGWEDVPKVKRRWDWSQMIPNQIRYKANESDDDNRARLARFFHLENGNRPNREGLVACRNSCRLLERNMRNVNNGEPNEELEFPVIKRTITIK